MDGPEEERDRAVECRGGTGVRLVHDPFAAVHADPVAHRVALGFPLRARVLGAAPTTLGGAQVSALEVRHVRLSEPHGLRVNIGGTLIAYSGDARWSEHLAAVAKGADLFICEASNFDREDPAHISYRQLMAHRDELGAKRIVLTHLGAETLAHLAELELEYATDGTLVEV